MESSSSSSLLLLLHPPPPSPPWRFPFSPLSLSSSHSPLSLRQSLGPIAARKFDFGPRSFNDNDDDDDFGNGDFDRTRRSKTRRRRASKQKQRWWFEEREREPSMLDQVIDGLWFLKVLRPYGWFLPIVLLSILLATGPKAFLMASSLPLGFSLLALAFGKLSAWLAGTPQPKKRRRPKSPFANGKPFSTEEEDDQEEEEEEESQPERRSQKRRYRSWAAGNNGSIHKGKSGSKFGGWDELIREEEESDRSFKPDQKTGEQDKPEQEVKSSMQMTERELPLLLKLLVALFPFLGSWTSFLR